MTRRRSRRSTTLPLSSTSLVETLESRQLYSFSAISAHISVPDSDLRHAAGRHNVASTHYQVYGNSGGTTTAARGRGKAKVTPAAGYASPVGKTPAQIRKAYGVDNILFGSAAGDGAGQTIAIVDAYDDPSLVSSTSANFAISDLHRFDQQFNLPDPPSFTKVSQSGSQSSLPAYDSGWAGEIALDVEWAHAMAPKANILLVEASSSSTTNLDAAVNYAKKQSGVSVVSMSYGTTEFYGETSYDSIYTTPSGHAGVTFFASTGDTGSPGSYQAYSPNVVAVGGTSLRLNSDGSYASESGWSGGGGGISSYESKPSYQSTVVTQTSSRRATPDVSAVADPNTGVAILETSAGGIGSSGGWEQIGGTSLASPVWAGMMAVADQGRALLGLNPLDGVSQTLPRLYSLNGSDFHDVTTGSNGGYSASAGYDLVTGRGTPVANQLIPDLAGGATIAGTVFNDANGDGTRESGEAALANTTVYLDLNNNGLKDSSEPSAVTNSGGAYSFTDLLGRVSYTVREITPSGYVATTPASLTLSSLYGTTTAGDFGLAAPPKTSFTGQSLTLRLDPTGNQIQVFNNSTAAGTPSYTFAKDLVSNLTFAGTSGNDSFTLDLANGNPLAGVTASYDGGAGSDAVSVLGSPSAADTVAFSNTAIAADGATLATANTESAAFDGRSGDDALSVAGTTPVTLAAGQRLQSLSISSGAKAVLAAGHNTLYTRSLSVASNAALDLTDGTLVDDDPDAAVSTVRSLLTTGYNAGAWAGSGINSSAAAGDAQKLTALGYFTAGDLGASSYDGLPVSPGAVIVRYTYYGDANLDGKVNADDVAITDLGKARGLTGWLWGDFNYDHTINSADSSLMDQPLQANAPAIA